MALCGARVEGAKGGGVQKGQRRVFGDSCPFARRLADGNALASGPLTSSGQCPETRPLRGQSMNQFSIRPPAPDHQIEGGRVANNLIGQHMTHITTGDRDHSKRSTRWRRPRDAIAD